MTSVAIVAKFTNAFYNFIRKIVNSNSQFGFNFFQIIPLFSFNDFEGKIAKK